LLRPAAAAAPMIAQRRAPVTAADYARRKPRRR
jgi:hypothetical protein